MKKTIIILMCLIVLLLGCAEEIQLDDKITEVSETNENIETEPEIEEDIEQEEFQEAIIETTKDGEPTWQLAEKEVRALWVRKRAGDKITGFERVDAGPKLGVEHRTLSDGSITEETFPHMYYYADINWIAESGTPYLYSQAIIAFYKIEGAGWQFAYSSYPNQERTDGVKVKTMDDYSQEEIMNMAEENREKMMEEMIALRDKAMANAQR